MKILFAVHTYYPEHNGVQFVTQYIAEGLAVDNQVSVITGVSKDTSTTEYLNTEEINGVLIQRIYVQLGKGHVFSGDKKKYLQIIEKYRPDIFICVCTQSWTFDWIINYLDEIKCKKVLYTHGFSAYMGHYPFLRDVIGAHIFALYNHMYWNWYYKRCWKYLKKFDLVTYLSKSSSSYSYSIKYNLVNSLILGNAVDDRMFEQCSLNNRKKSQEIGFIYVANYDENKNQQMALEAFYKAITGDATLTLIGTKRNKYYQNLLGINCNLAKKYGNKGVSILVGISRDEIMCIEANSDVFICSSKHEEFPIMLCEAAAKGLAIISTNVGNISSFPNVDVVNDINEMADCITIYSNNRNKRVEAGESLRNYAQMHFREYDKINQFEKALYKL